MAVTQHHHPFNCSRINDDTFLIVESDVFKENPFIYAKIYTIPPLIILSDTGCGGRYVDAGKTHTTALRDFLEVVPISANDDKPLNPRDEKGKPEKGYFIICTHCHYDRR